MMSSLEQRRIVESAFLSLKCICNIGATGDVSIQIQEPATGVVKLNIGGISRSNLLSSRTTFETGYPDQTGSENFAASPQHLAVRHPDRIAYLVFR